MGADIFLNLVIDEVENKVVYAEGDRDFVDVLLSFLVRPIGTAVRLTGDKLNIGCMDSLYKSVESLDIKHFNTEVCKKILLFPINADHTHCHRLVVPMDDCSMPYYACPDWKDKDHRFITSVQGTKCSCGKKMFYVSRPLYDDEIPSKETPSNVGVFLKGMNKYLITDDLRISIIGTLSVNELWKEGVKQVHRLREKKVKVGRQEVLNLLKHALVSKTALSDTFIGKKTIETSWKPLEIAFLKQISKSDKGRKLTMDLVVNKSDGKFLYAQGKEDVANFFFSFLTFPLGLLSNIYNGNSSIGCIDELRSSAKLLSEEGQLRTDAHFQALHKPVISAHHSFMDQILNIKEGRLAKITYTSRTTLHTINPKSPSFTTKKGGGFVNGPGTFMISDNLEIKAASVSRDLSVFRKHDNVKKIPVVMGEIEALKLLHASLTSSTPLSSVFFEQTLAKTVEQLPAKKAKKKVHQRIVDGIRGWIKLWKKERSL